MATTSVCYAQHTPERDLPNMASFCYAQHAPAHDLPDMASVCYAQHTPERDLPDMASFCYARLGLCVSLSGVQVTYNEIETGHLAGLHSQHRSLLTLNSI